MRSICITGIVRIASLLFLVTAGGRALAQGPPDIVWTAPDGAGTVTFSPGGQLLASAGSGTLITLRRAADGGFVRTLRDKSGINSIAFSPDGQLLADGRTNGSNLNLKMFRVS